MKELTIPTGNTKSVELIIDKRWIMEQPQADLKRMNRKMLNLVREGYIIDSWDDIKNPMKVVYRITKP